LNTEGEKNMKASHVARFACAALLITLPGPLVLAQTATAGQPLARPFATSAGFDTPVASATLEDYRGGTQVVRNDMELAGTTAGNSASHLVTGANSISAGAFSNMSGLPVVIQNSGANVLIQNAVIVHLQMD
jgi:hypothetical protein